jgi:outer membrane murein-binding lipoprotein Lpp
MIKIEDFEQLRKKIAAAKDKESRINGALDQIEEQLKKEPDIKNIDDAETVVNKLNTEIEKLLKEQEALLVKLDKVVEWNKL